MVKFRGYLFIATYKGFVWETAYSRDKDELIRDWWNYCDDLWDSRRKYRFEFFVLNMWTVRWTQLPSWKKGRPRVEYNDILKYKEKI
jgi:hypothetical protein